VIVAGAPFTKKQAISINRRSPLNKQTNLCTHMEYGGNCRKQSTLFHLKKKNQVSSKMNRKEMRTINPGKNDLYMYVYVKRVCFD
jgi:hypothetical protein